MKKKRKIFRVKPRRVFPYGWNITEESKIIGTTFYLKTAAIAFAVGIAKGSVPSQVVIYKRNGRIQSERTYGQDPERSKG